MITDWGIRLLKQDLIEAQKRLESKLRNLDIKSLGLSEYTEHYCSFLLSDLTETLSRFRQVLEIALESVNRNPKELSILDYGGGVGLQSMLAKELGIGKVYYNDIFEGSCLDAKILAASCDLPADDYIHGDAKEVVDFLNRLEKGIDSIVSYDVIEHVYDVEANFKTFAELDTAPRNFVYGSGANIKNPFYVHQVSKSHQMVELVNRSREKGHKDRDSTSSYLEIRKEFILSLGQALTQEEVERLAIQTRGLILKDIDRVITQYCKTGDITYSPKHPTNTCDPNTGNWCEQLLDFEWLESVAVRAGFEARIEKGVYSISGSLSRKTKRVLMNCANLALGRAGFTFAPFYVLVLKPARE
jgi:2-polyprenyl-3-methyl-5-hydroxy-6-metoxy-1,4-benzoquinol methylase